VADNFWLNDEQWAAIEPHLPMVQTGPERKNDRHRLRGADAGRAGRRITGSIKARYRSSPIA
jgi:transposase